MRNKLNQSANLLRVAMSLADEQLSMDGHYDVGHTYGATMTLINFSFVSEHSGQLTVADTTRRAQHMYDQIVA